MENRTTNILIVGVGGQGVLLASEILSDVAMKAGYDTKKSEVHGMSQRGGVVSSHVKYGPKVYSPIIPYGQADILISFEQAEALRAMDWIRKDGLIATSTTRLIPPSAMNKDNPYPDDPVEMMRRKMKNVIAINADKIALELGNIRLVNTLLLGVISSRLEFGKAVWEESFRARVKPQFVDINLVAFAKGQQLASAKVAV